MKINSTKFKDLKLIKLKKFNDLRGQVVKIFDKKNKSLKFDCFESYISKSKKGTVRGLHGQTGKFSQAKLIVCIKGEALDIAIDLRKKSKTYGKVFKKFISSKNQLAVYIPKGFVHGYIILKNNTTMINLCSTAYNPKKEFGINIKSINLNIPKMKMYFSDKDKNLIGLKNYIKSQK